MQDPTRILLAGDIHGNSDHFAYLLEIAQQYGCETIFPLGDFGFFPHSADDVLFLAKVAHDASAINIDVVWIDGNHENHSELEVLCDEAWRHTSDGFVLILPGLYYSPRGHAWTWGGRKFLSLGGAFSVDKGWRVAEEQKYHRPYTLWWPQETITQADIYRSLAAIDEGGTVDIMVTHDAPAGLKLPNWRPWLDRKWPEADANREALRAVVDAAQPRMLFHGHLHFNHEEWLDINEDHTVRVVGLNCDGNQGRSWAVLDLTTMEVIRDA